MRLKEKEKIRQDMEKAVRDPSFMKDLNASMAAFEFADQEAGPEDLEW